MLTPAGRDLAAFEHGRPTGAWHHESLHAVLGEVASGGAGGNPGVWARLARREAPPGGCTSLAGNGAGGNKE